MVYLESKERWRQEHHGEAFHEMMMRPNTMGEESPANDEQYLNFGHEEDIQVVVRGLAHNCIWYMVNKKYCKYQVNTQVPWARQIGV